ncbi:MAG: methylmalonyl Co-A mutase-associated GTPase MeaB [Deltaproteobacteria bacterium]|jgi:LAO/AO transport system kinase|nr:methylmalonyl Co-A mutase-associated GTPase MeaB [Deltaproteobacteria bacterium]
MPPEPSTEGEPSPEALAEGVIAGDRAAISRALNWVDDSRPSRREQALRLLDALEGRGRGTRIGVTGAPGAGKSTLLDALVARLRADGRSVGILAVDPSSQRSGGALLGDRMRLGAGARDAGVFLRSLAARDRLGGLSEVTGPSLDVLVAAFDAVFVETVGVGQSESEVIDLVDSLVFVAQPAAGDLIQFMKAGILEWPDVFFVNKADLGDAAERTVGELQAGLELGDRRDPSRPPPVLSGSAREGSGIDALVEALDAHRRHLEQTSNLDARRQAGRLARVRTALATRYGRFGLERLEGELAIEAFCEAHPRASVLRIVDELGRAIERRLGPGGG